MVVCCLLLWYCIAWLNPVYILSGSSLSSGVQGWMLNLSLGFPIMATYLPHIMCSFNQHEIELSIKYYLEHLMRNVIARFKLLKTLQPKICSMMSEAQASENSNTFHGVMQQMSKLTIQSDSNLGCWIVLYLLSIHPIHWTVFGNRKSQHEIQWKKKYCQMILGSLITLEEVDGDEDPMILYQRIIWEVDSTIPCSKKLPLLFTCHNNSFWEQCRCLQECWYLLSCTFLRSMFPEACHPGTQWLSNQMPKCWWKCELIHPPQDEVV
jgi:hypothetical protein